MGAALKFVLYGAYYPCTYADAFMATSYKGFDFSFEELDCDSVLIAFNGGREVDRTYDMDKLSDWVASVATPVGRAPSIEYSGGAIQDPLPGLEYPPCQ